MKTSSYFPIFIFTLATALTGCSSSQNSVPETDSYLHIRSCRAQGESITGINDFGLFVTTEDGSNYDTNSNNAHVILQSDKWEIPPISIKSNNPGKLFAYYPYIDDATVTGITVNLLPQTDYLFSKGQTVTSTSYTPDIELHHVLSKVTVSVNDESVSDISVADYPMTGVLNLFAGTLTKNNGKGTITSGKSEILLFPGSNEGLTFDITYQGESYQYSPADTDYEAGKEYTYSLILQENNQLTISQVTIRNWQIGGNYEGTIDSES